MSVILKGGTSADLVDVTTNKELKVALTDVADDAGYVRLLDGAGGALSVTENEYLRVSSDSLLFYEQVDGVNLNTNMWTYTATTMTLTQTAGFIVLNAGASVAVNTNVILNSIRAFPLFGDQPVHFTINAKVNLAAPIANNTIELGIGAAAAQSAPTDGCFFRWTAGGNFLAVINSAGSETTSAPLTAPTANDVHLFDIELVEDLVRFFIDDELVASVVVPLPQAYPVNAGRQMLLARVYNGASAPASAGILSIGQVSVCQEVSNPNKLWKETLAGLGRGSYQSPLTAFGQTASVANNGTPTSVTLSNTAAGYTTLGGRYQFVAPAGAVTDYVLFSYATPAAYQLFITSIAITAMNTGAAVATTATIMEWQIGVNASAVTLVTVDAVGPPQTWAARRLALGMQGLQVGAGIGQNANDIVRTFDPPLVCDSGRQTQVIVQIPVGTATASQIIRGTVTITGYFE